MLDRIATVGSGVLATARHDVELAKAAAPYFAAAYGRPPDQSGPRGRELDS